MAKLESLLIIDDNERCVEFLSLAFQSRGGFEVLTETRSIMALDRIRVEKPDLVVLDIKMPDIDGFSVLTLLRGEGNPVPVVMCSGSARQQDVDRAYASGCNGYVAKPASLDDYRNMASAIVDYWGRSELPRH